MNILCMNTAFLQADLAVSLNDNKKYKKFDSTCKHSEHIMLGINELLSGTKVNNLDYMAVCVGTGSFTGIRIGISVAEGFKTANDNLKLVAISSFELAVKSLQVLPNQKFAVVFNALGGRYFVQYFENDVAVSQPELLHLDEIENIYKIGLKDENLDFCDQYVSFLPETLLSLTYEKIKKCQWSDSLQPLYVRQSQAEENLANTVKK